MFGWFKSRSLQEAVNETKRVKVQGVIFRLKKLDPLDYVAGAKALHAHFTTYEDAKKPEPESTVATQRRIKEHYIDVIMCSVVEPKLSRKKDEEGAIFVENLFSDWSLVEELYLKIIEVTYGKKKLLQYRSRLTA